MPSPPITPAFAETGNGLSSADALARLARDGPNLLPQSDRRSWPRLAADVLREPMLLLLLAATGLYVLLGETADAAILAASIAMVIALTLYQSWRSERALQALRDLSAPNAKVVRDGATGSIPSAELVVGDLILLAEGDRIPADARLVEADDFRLDESLLTGESVPVARSPGSAAASTIYAGTLVVRGQSMAEVIATGARTQTGRIGNVLRAIRTEPTPLQREVRRLVAWFATLGVASCALVVVLYGTFRDDWLQATLAGITLAMANIPEEFPVVLAVFLALGAWRMARYRVLVRRPVAIEALGSVTTLCTDKTGTLTLNRMAVARLQTEEGTSDVAGPLSPAAAALLRCAAMASDQAGFDPMDQAILALSSLHCPNPSVGYERRKQYPVSSELPAYAIAWRDVSGQAIRIACKGAPEAVAMLCGLDETSRLRWLGNAASMAAEGLRVIAVADFAQSGAHQFHLPSSIRELRFNWCGLLGLADPMRAEVPAAVAEARSAGIRVILMTGDHLETARAIAAAAGLGENARVVLGADLEDLDNHAIDQLLNDTNVFARVKPAHKLRLVEALKAQGEVVAMTGDGVNDAPALAAAHVGIAMGGRGTDVAREAATIVLLDDDFASIIRAVRMGRTIYDNLRRASRYIIAVHVPITGLALLPILLGMPLILLPLHVVFMEMLIDPAASIVLEREPSSADLMRRPPRAKRGSLITRSAFVESVVLGLVVLAAVMAVLYTSKGCGSEQGQSAALAFAALMSGNVALIAAHKARASDATTMGFAFWAIAFLAAALLVPATLFEVPASWLGFVPAPIPALLAACLAPWFALAAARRLKRSTRHIPRLGNQSY